MNICSFSAIMNIINHYFLQMAKHIIMWRFGVFWSCPSVLLLSHQVYAEGCWGPGCLSYAVSSAALRRAVRRPRKLRRRQHRASPPLSLDSRPTGSPPGLWRNMQETKQENRRPITYENNMSRLEQRSYWRHVPLKLSLVPATIKALKSTRASQAALCSLLYVLDCVCFVAREWAMCHLF